MISLNKPGKIIFVTGLIVFCISLSFAQEWNCFGIPDSEIEIFNIGPATKMCPPSPLGGEVDCLIVNGEPMAIDIRGFSYELGYIYRLKVKRCNLNIPFGMQYDGGLGVYNLMELMSKNRGNENLYFLERNFYNVIGFISENLDYIFSGLVLIGGIRYLIYRERKFRNKKNKLDQVDKIPNEDPNN